MKEHINVISQVVTALAVIIGLGLVIWELQEQRTLTRVQLSAGNNEKILEMWTTHLGEDHHDIQKKACLSPEDITAEDAVILDSLYSLYWTMAVRIPALQGHGDLYSEEFVEHQISLYLSLLMRTDHGVRWWDINKTLLPNTPGFIKIGDEIKRRRIPKSCSLYIQELTEIPHENT